MTSVILLQNNCKHCAISHSCWRWRCH